MDDTGQADEGRASAPLDKSARPCWVEAEGRAITPHGFRATFRTWAGDRTSFAREIIEAALAHAMKDKVEAAYTRTDLLDRRRALMAAWAEHAVGTAGGDVVDVAARRSSGE